MLVSTLVDRLSRRGWDPRWGSVWTLRSVGRPAVVTVLTATLLGALLAVGVASVGGPRYHSSSVVVFTAVQAPGRGQLGTEAQYVESRAITWAAMAGSAEILHRVANRLGRANLPGESSSGVALTGTELVRVSVSGPDPAGLPRQATLAGQALVELVDSAETPLNTTLSRVTGAVSEAGGAVVDDRAQWQLWSAVLGGLFGALLAWLACALVRPGRWTRRIDRTPALPAAEGAARLAEAVHDEIMAWVRAAGTRRGLAVLGAVAFAVFGYALTGSALPPLLVVLAAGYAGRKDPRWPVAALLLLGLTVLPDKVELMHVGPITPTVLEVALVLALVATYRPGRPNPGRSVFTGPIGLVLAAVAAGAVVGVLRHGLFSEISDTVRALLVVTAFFAVRRAFAGRLPQLLGLLLVGAAAASMVELLATAAGWQRLLVDERASVLTGADLTSVSRLSAPVLPLWGPLIILLVSGAIATRPRWLWFALLLPGVVHEALSFNRSTWAPLLACVVLVAVVCHGIRGVIRRGLAIGIIGILMIGLAGVGLFGTPGKAIAERASSVVTGSALDEDSLADRLREDTAAMGTLLADPLLGTGVGVSYGGELVSYDNLLDYTLVQPRPWIHNQYLRIWLLMGAFGLLAFGLLMVRVIAVVTRCWSVRAPGAVVVVASGLGLACLAAQAVLQTNLVDRPTSMTVAVLLAVAALGAEWAPLPETISTLSTKERIMSV